MGLRSHGEKAGWHLFRVPEGDEPITLQRRGLLPNGGVGLIEERQLVKA
jgi:hypothetical protein